MLDDGHRHGYYCAGHYMRGLQTHSAMNGPECGNNWGVESRYVDTEK